MRLFSTLSLFLALLSLIGTTLTVPVDNTPAAEPDANLSPLFRLQKGSVDIGGCDAKASVLEKSYIEAIKMIEKVDIVIEQLQQGTAANVMLPGVRASRVALLYNMFRVWITWLGTVALENPATYMNPGGLPDISFVYLGILEYAHDPVPPDRVQKLVICSAAGIIHLGPNDPHPADRTGKMKVNSDGKYPNGIYYSEGNYGDASRGLLMPAYTDTQLGWGTTGVVPTAQQYYCAHTDANSIEWDGSDLHVVLFCDSAWKLAVTVDPAKVQSGAMLDSADSLSSLWVHELTHLWGPYPNDRKVIDQVAVVEDPAQRVVPEPALDGDWIVSPLNTAGKTAYKTEPCMALAQNYPADALFNADNYALFALAIWLDKWNWAYGFAQPFPQVS